MTKQPNFLDKFTTGVIKSSPRGIFSGAAASGTGVALISATPAVPEDWEAWFQWPCFAIFIFGILWVVKNLLWPN